MTDAIRISVHESMFVVDGGPEARLPSGSGGPILAGPEAVLIAGRVEHDAPTLFRVGDPRGQGNLILAHTGAIATPGRVLRILSISHDVLAEIRVTGLRTSISIYLTDLDEPDEIFVSVDRDAQSERAPATAT